MCCYAQLMPAKRHGGRGRGWGVGGVDCGGGDDGGGGSGSDDENGGGGYDGVYGGGGGGVYGSTKEQYGILCIV